MEDEHRQSIEAVCAAIRSARIAGIGSVQVAFAAPPSTHGVPPTLC